MAEEIRIPVVSDLSGEQLTDYFRSFIYKDDDDSESPTGVLAAALDLVVDDRDDRATLDDVEIVGASVEGDDVEIEFDVTYSASYGCRDMNYTDQDSRTARGRRDGADWVFEEYVQPTRLSPSEEL